MSDKPVEQTTVFQRLHSLLRQGPIGLQFRIKHGVAWVAVTGADELIRVHEDAGLCLTVELVDAPTGAIDVRVERMP